MPNSPTISAAALLGARLLMSAIFLHEAFVKIAGFAGAAGYMQAAGLPPVLLPVAIAVELGCGLAILAGAFTRYAALLLAGFCVVTAVLFHTKFGETNQLLHFEKNLSMTGGFLALWVAGAGAWSLDAWFGSSSKT
jgi:putative oxidoreductase